MNFQINIKLHFCNACFVLLKGDYYCLYCQYHQYNIGGKVTLPVRPHWRCAAPRKSTETGRNGYSRYAVMCVNSCTYYTLNCTVICIKKMHYCRWCNNYVQLCIVHCICYAAHNNGMQGWQTATTLR